MVTCVVLDVTVADVSVPTANPVTLTCKVGGAIDPPLVEWTVNNVEVRATHRTSAKSYNKLKDVVFNTLFHYTNYYELFSKKKKIFWTLSWILLTILGNR